MQLRDYKDSKLDKEFPEFGDLMREYHDGILLFNLTDELVWTKAVKDTTGLADFYEKNKENYKWDKRLDAVVYNAIDKKMAEQTISMIKDKKSENEIIEEINRSSQLNLKYEKKKFLKGENEYIDQIDWKAGVSKFINSNGRVYFVNVKEVLEPTYKTLDDSRGIITSDYQEYLEKQWISSLREKYNYTIDEDVLKELKSELK